MAPSSQEWEPPGNPGRFNRSRGGLVSAPTWRGCLCRWVRLVTELDAQRAAEIIAASVDRIDQADAVLEELRAERQERRQRGIDLPAWELPPVERHRQVGGLPWRA